LDVYVIYLVFTNIDYFPPSSIFSIIPNRIKTFSSAGLRFPGPSPGVMGLVGSGHGVLI